MRILFLSLCMVLSGCVGSKPEAPANPTWLRWASPNPVPLEQLSHCRSPQCLPFSGLVREGLSKVTWEGSALVTQPALAQSWEQSDKSWTVTLKDNLKWNDGVPLKAADLIENWKDVLTHCRKYPAASLLFLVENAEAFCMGKASASSIGWKAVDAKTVEFTLNRAHADFPQAFAHPVLWPARPAPSEKSVLSIGPFQPAGRNKRGDVRFVHNPKYHGTPAAMDGVLVQWISDPEVRLEMFLQGETDLVTDLPDPLWSSLASEKRLVVVPTDDFYVVLFDPKVSPFGEKVVRQAFQKTFEPQEALDLMKPFLAPAAGFFPSSPRAPVPKWAVLFSPKGLGATVQKWIDPMPKIKGASTIGYRASGSDPLLAKLVENLQVQWQRRLGIQVVTAESLGKKPGIRIFSTNLSPLGGAPSLDRFVGRYLGEDLGETDQKDWIPEQAFALPLGFRTQPYLLGNRIDGMNCPGIVPCDLSQAKAAAQ